jgi:capsular exopolysaccharide synthesis family protein
LNVTRLREALERANQEQNAGASHASTPPISDANESAEQSWQLDEDFPLAPAERGDAARASQRFVDAPVISAAAAASPATTADAGGESSSFQHSVAEQAPFAAKLVVRSDAEASVVEQFRRMAAALHHAQLQNGVRTVMVASAIEKEGKTLTSTNLALTLSQSYRRRVLLVDADLRHPAIHNSFGLNNVTGLGDVLTNPAASGALPVHQISPTLWLMTAGRPTSDPMAGLVSDTMKQFLAEAAAQFDWVVLDTPPVALLSDANLLAAMVDTAVLVVSAMSTPYPLALRAVEAIGGPDRVLGAVLNRAARSELVGGYAHYGYAYDRRNGDKANRRRKFRLAFTRNE